MARRRLDTLLTERGLAESRSAAAISIRAGLVRVGRGGERALKPSQMVAEDVEVEVEKGRQYVSRGGFKLEGALDELGVDVEGLDCLDVGASNGGFTDCLLKRGAARVIALDVGRGQLDWKLRGDDRVVSLEGVNARRLRQGWLPFAPELATIDVSFISLGKVVAPVGGTLAPGGAILAMVKPQFELGPSRVGKGGVVRSRPDRIEAVQHAWADAKAAGLKLLGAAPAGIEGPRGNREVFLHLSAGGETVTDPDAAIEAAIR